MFYTTYSRTVNDPHFMCQQDLSRITHNHASNSICMLKVTYQTVWQWWMTCQSETHAHTHMLYQESLFSQTSPIPIQHKMYWNAPHEPVIHCVRFPRRDQIISYMKTHGDPSDCSGSTNFPFKYLQRYRWMDLWDGRLKCWSMRQFLNKSSRMLFRNALNPLCPPENMRNITSPLVSIRRKT